MSRKHEMQVGGSKLIYFLIPQSRASMTLLAKIYVHLQKEKHIRFSTILLCSPKFESAWKYAYNETQHINIQRKVTEITNRCRICFFIPYSSKYERKQPLFDATMKASNCCFMNILQSRDRLSIKCSTYQTWGNISDHRNRWKTEEM